MTELLDLSHVGNFPIDGRELHQRLNVGTAYKDWFPRMCEYGFEENVDFNPLKNEQVRFEGKREVAREIATHKLTISMAKEICMLQRTEQGKEVRRYLIGVEEHWNSPESVMARAVQFANSHIKALEGEKMKLEADKSRLMVEKQIMQPKAEYFDELVERGVNLSIRETAKQLQTKEKQFVAFLLDHKYVYRDKKGKLAPYAHHMEKGLFVMKECYNEKTSWGGSQTLITPKGRETFRLLLEGLRNVN